MTYHLVIFSLGLVGEFSACISINAEARAVDQWTNNREMHAGQMAATAQPL
jgi:hypothetical protein